MITNDFGQSLKFYMLYHTATMIEYCECAHFYYACANHMRFNSFCAYNYDVLKSRREAGKINMKWRTESQHNNTHMASTKLHEIRKCCNQLFQFWKQKLICVVMWLKMVCLSRNENVQTIDVAQCTHQWQQ